MDRQRFDKIAGELVERGIKNSPYGKKLKRLFEQGKPLPDSYEDSLTWRAKPRMRPCEDCTIISTNNLKHIEIIRTKNGVEWIKKCDECGKKMPFSPG